MLNVFEIFIMGMKPSTSRVCVCVNGQGLVGGDFVRLCPLMLMFGCWVYRFLVLCFCFHFMSLIIWFGFKIIENNVGKLRETHEFNNFVWFSKIHLLPGLGLIYQRIKPQHLSNFINHSPKREVEPLLQIEFAITLCLFRSCKNSKH